MTNKQALREKFEQWWEINYHNGNPPRFGWERWRDGDGYQIDDDESELDGMWEAWQAAHSSKLEAAEKLIAELQVREVKLPQRHSMLCRTDFNEDYSSHMAFKEADVIEAIRASGIHIKGSSNE